MINLEKLLSRVMSNGSLDTGVYTAISSALTQPMMMNPTMIDSTIKTMLISAKATEDVQQTESVPAAYYNEIKTGVLDISGAMTAREISVPCAKSPASYEAIKATMSAMIDSGAEFVVARFNSGGGMASQMMDLSRWVKSQREHVRLIAVIDDNAYSAAYGIASAFDTIYVSETSGAGSVGVVLRHASSSDENETVTYITAGDKKADGNGDEPLSESAKTDLQAEVDRLYGLFTATVADNLGINLEDVIATQAGTLHGKDIITRGFAHKMGGFQDVINLIYTGEEMTKTEIEEARARATAAQSKINTAQAKVDRTVAKIDAEEAKLSADVDGVDDLISDLQDADTPKADTPKADVGANVDTTPKADVGAGSNGAAANVDEDVLANFVDKLGNKTEALADEVEARRVETIKSMCKIAKVDESLEKSFIDKGFSTQEVSDVLLGMTNNDNVQIDTFKDVNPSADTEATKSEKLRASWKNAFGNI